MKSIRATLTIGLLAGVVLAAVSAGVVLYSRVKASIVAQFDSALVAKARALGTQLDIDGRHIAFDYVPGLMPEFEGGERPEYFQMSTADGAVLERSDTLAKAEQKELPVRFGPTDRPQCFDLALPDGRAGRAAGILIAVESDDLPADPVDSGDSTDRRPRIVIVVARARAEIDAALASVRGALGLAGIFLLAAAALIVALTVRHGLRPLAVLARQLVHIDAARLSGRVDRAGMPAELTPAVDKLNELLERLEAAFARERRMTANIAHELRTPIAELKTAAEIAQRWPDDVALRDSAIETAHAVSDRMSTLVIGLLRLARVAAGTTRLELEDVDLHDLVESTWRTVAAAASERGVRFEHDASGPLPVRADRTLLSIVVGNLMENAARFADDGSTITCSAVRSADSARVTWTLANHARQLTAADVPHLTEPFWQKNGARSDGAHAGLGLTLVREAVKALGAEISFRFDRGLAVDVTLVASESSRAAHATRVDSVRQL